MRREAYAGAAFAGALIALGLGIVFFDERAAVEAAGAQAPIFEVDPFWPKPLPNHWRIGSAIGVAVDARDHVWIVHRPQSLQPKELYAEQKPPAATCCSAAPPVLEFDPEGNLVGHWGGKGEGFRWPASNHGITVDHKGNVWIGSNGQGDSTVLKFTPAGKLLMMIGREGSKQDSHDVNTVNRPAKIFVDPASNEVYVADGYGNRRVIVYDGDTGKYKRHWGAYGNRPDDTPLGNYNPDEPPAKQFRTPVHCAELSKDGLLYVCDRQNDRIQVFTKDGKFVKEVFIEKRTLGDGSVFDIAFSKDPQQKYLYVADASNQKVHIILRESMEVLTTFGDGGRQPGQFYAVHSIATDSKGNIYTTETYEGKRLQKFVFKGVGPVTKKDQGTVWPKRAAR